MSRTCDLCSRGANRANWRSHSNVAKKRRQFVNLQAVKVGGEKSRVCTRCVRTLKRRAAAKAK